MDRRKGKATFPEMNENNIEASSEGNPQKDVTVQTLRKKGSSDRTSQSTQRERMGSRAENYGIGKRKWKIKIGLCKDE